MAVLPYTLKQNLTNHHAFLEELKNFCQSAGWTIVRFQQNIQWKTTSPQSFIAGNESYLEITSTGYAGQTLHFRFRMENTGSDPLHEWLQMGAHLGNTTLQSVSSHPVDQSGKWNTNKHLSIPSITIPNTWFFGNDKFIFVVIQCDSSYVQFLSFGTLELFNGASETQAIWAGYAHAGTTNQEWHKKNAQCPFDFNGNNIYYDSVQKASSDCGWGFTCTTSNGITQGKFASYGDAVLRNQGLDVRIPVKQIMYMKESGDSLWIALGWSWIFRVWHEGLLIGEKITYGSKEFLTFPMGRLDERFLGVAVRVN